MIQLKDIRQNFGTHDNLCTLLTIYVHSPGLAQLSPFLCGMPKFLSTFRYRDHSCFFLNLLLLFSCLLLFILLWFINTGKSVCSVDTLHNQLSKCFSGNQLHMNVGNCCQKSTKKQVQMLQKSEEKIYNMSKGPFPAFQYHVFSHSLGVGLGGVR